MREKIIALVEEETGKQVTMESDFDSLGMDSLEFVDLILKAQQLSGKAITDAEVAKINTVGDLVSAVA